MFPGDIYPEGMLSHGEEVAMFDLFQLFTLVCGLLYIAIAAAEGIQVYCASEAAWWLKLPMAIAGGFLLPGKMLVVAVITEWTAAIKALLNPGGWV